MRAVVSIALFSLIAPPAWAAEAKLTVTIPRLTVAEYHRPYIAVWLERSDQSVAGNILVWYDLNQKNGEGTKWLKDLRQWWRRSGRDLQMPVDGLSSATRPPGEHAVALDVNKPPFSSLAAGEYHLMVEAAREVGGRELLRTQFQWPPKEAQMLKMQGEHELSAVTFEIKP